MFEFVNFLNSGGYSFFRVFKVEWGLPLVTGNDFNSTELLVFMLKFRHQFNGITCHLFFGESNFRNFFYFLIEILL